jgi:hypothetical protein
MATAPRATSAHLSLALSPAERATVAVKLAGLSARVASLAARLDRLHTALAAPEQPVVRTQMAAAPITRVSAVHAIRAGGWPGHRYGGAAMAVTREQLLADPNSSARPLSPDEHAERARNAELAGQWFPATSPFGRRCEVQVSDPGVLDDMRRAGWRIHQPRSQAEPEPEAV